VKVAAKEAEETEYWLMLCKHSENYPEDQTLIDQVVVLKKIMSKILSNARK